MDDTYVYWANWSTGKIGRAKLDGSEPNQEWISGASGLHGVAVDGTYVYWANFNTDKIGRVNNYLRVSYAPVSKEGDAGEGGEGKGVSEKLTGLTPETVYHFQLYAKNADGQAFGENREFTTLASAEEGEAEAAVSVATQEQRWKSGDHIGPAKPTLKVYIRRGHLERHYKNLPKNEVFSFTPGLGGPRSVWYAEWVPDEDYVEAPGVLSAKGDGNFEQKGVEQVTVEIDNILMLEKSGASGIFHELDRGHMSPLRGQREFQGQSIGTENEWSDKWRDEATQIVILAGYGEAYFPLFLGLIDDCDLNSRPDRIVVTARNMGKTLTDQRVFMDAKNLWTRDPITFQDRQQADLRHDVVTSVRAKSTDGSHPARYAIDDNEDTAWVSARHGNPNQLEWIEAYIPHARVEEMKLFVSGEGMELYFSVHATNEHVPAGGQARGTNGTHHGEGWISEGLGNVPGTTIPFVRHINTAKVKPIKYGIRKGGGGYLLGDHSKVRIWFRNLSRIKVKKGTRYQAALRDFKVFKSNKDEAAIESHWILVDDVSDIVKTVLQWAGFRADGVHAEWEIETVGVRLADKLVIDRQTFLMDIIWKIAEMTSYVFYVKPPSTFDQDDLTKGNQSNLSTGVAVFRQSNAMRDTPPAGEQRYLVRDTDLISDIKPHFSNEPLSDSIRVRGTTVAKGKKRRNPHVHPLGADRQRRYQYSYRPVWARGGRRRFGHVRKPTVHYDEQVDTVFQAKVACLLIALRQALEGSQATLEFALFPPIHLDHQLVLHDTGTALSTRLWVASRSWEYQGGETVRFSMNLQGALLDVPDVTETVAELTRLLNQRGWDPAPIARGPWTEPKFF